MSELHCSVMVLFSTLFSCFLLDLYELQELISIVSQNMKPLSLLSISRGVISARVMMNALDTDVVTYVVTSRHDYVRNVLWINKYEHAFKMAW